MRWSRKSQRRLAPAPERLEDRLVPSASSFAALPPLAIAGGEPGQVPAVGHYHSGNAELPFLAVTYVDSSKGGGVNIFLGLGQGQFPTKPNDNIHFGPPNAEPEGIVVGQFTQSGFDDLAVADNNGNVYIVLGNGDGTFKTPASRLSNAKTTSLTYLATTTIGGLPYLFVSDFSENEILVYRGDGTGGFTPSTSLQNVFGPNQIVAAKFNRDGDADLAVANKENDSVSVFEGDGSGGFNPQPTIIPLHSSGGRGQPIGLAVADLDGDGALDLAVADYGRKSRTGGALVVLRNIGASQDPILFKVERRIAVGQRLVNVVAVGLGDSLPGLVVTSSGTNSVIVLQNRGSFVFRGRASVKVGKGPQGMVASKVTNDNPLANDDLIVATYNSATIRVLKNRTMHM